MQELHKVLPTLRRQAAALPLVIMLGSLSANSTRGHQTGKWNCCEMRLLKGRRTSIALVASSKTFPLQGARRRPVLRSTPLGGQAKGGETLRAGIADVYNIAEGGVLC